MSVRQAIWIVNGVAIVVIVGIIIGRVVSLRRNPEPSEPQNLTPFLPDEDLEGRKLDRVLLVAFSTIVVIAVATAVYYLYEPNRQARATKTFDQQAVQRGATLFANDQMKAYDPTRSLLCANCHGTNAQGGTANFTIKSDDPRCDPTKPVTDKTPSYCLPVQVSWQAPPLDVALLRYTRDQVKNIVTYGRPGTPMPPWGVASGKGVLNEQGIDDVVSYLQSITITPAQAQKRFTQQLKDTRTNAANAVQKSQQALSDAQASLAAATTPDQQQAAQQSVTNAQTALQAAQTRNDQVQAASDGELLFQLQCARCHTKNWSFYDPNNPNPVGPPPGPQGGGAYGPNLRDGDTVRQFAGPDGVQLQIDWVTNGKPANEQYGVRGISSGRMPHFGSVLTKDQIQQIVNYERGL